MGGKPLLLGGVERVVFHIAFGLNLIPELYCFLVDFITVVGPQGLYPVLELLGAAQPDCPVCLFVLAQKLRK